MRTHAVTCAVCEQRFALAAAAIPAQPTCSPDCKDAVNRRRARRRRLVAWFQPIPCPPVGHHRVREALAETRAAVEKLLADGREIARAS